MENRFAQAASTIVAALFVVVIAVLVFMAAASTCFITFDDASFSGGEHTFFVPDYPVLNICAFAASAALAYLVTRLGAYGRFRARLDDDRFFGRCERILLIVLFIVAVAWLFLTLAIPGADQRTVQRIVLQCLQGDWSAFGEGGYMSSNAHQIGFFWFSYPFALVFGQYAAAFIEGSNAIALVIAYKVLADLAGNIGASRMQRLLVIASGIAFYPFIQFCSFVYGISWGFAFALLALWWEMRFFANGRWRFAAASAAGIACAIMMKSNYLVFFIGMALYALVELIGARKVKVLGFFALLAVAYVLQANLPAAAAERASGYDVGHPSSSWSWIAMGLQDGTRAPGWYNAYNIDSYNAAGHDPAVQAEANKADIRQSLADFASGERDAVAFFAQKVDSQWNNPTFQGYWNVERRRAAIALLPVMQDALSADGVDAAVRLYLNWLEFAVLCGALSWALLADWRASGFYRQLVLPLVFLGGFACHLLWEAKSQYAVQYFVLLLPYAVMGYAALLRALRGVRHAGAAGALREVMARAAKRQAAPLATLAVSAVLVIAFCAGGNLTSITCDAQAYDAWLASDPVPPIIERTSLVDLDEEDVQAKLEGSRSDV